MTEGNQTVAARDSKHIKSGGKIRINDSGANTDRDEFDKILEEAEGHIIKKDLEDFESDMNSYLDGENTNTMGMTDPILSASIDDMVNLGN